jgi:hypothetical protein
MKKIALAIIFAAITMIALSQNNLSISLTRPSKFQGVFTKIIVKINNKEVVLSNGESKTITISVADLRAITIYANAMGSRAELNFNPIDNENYAFETSFDLKGIYIKKLSGEESPSGLVSTGENKADWNTNLKKAEGGTALAFTAEKTNSSDDIREEWLKKGGKVRYLSRTLNGMYFSTEIEGQGKMVGYGAGASSFYNFFNLKLPEYKPGKANWNSFNWGIGVDMLMYSMKYGYDEALFRVNMNTLMLNLMVTAELGWTLGIGKYRSQDQWKGVALILKYRPSYNIVMGSSTVEIISSTPYLPNSTTTANIDPTGNLNLGGFGFDIQFSNIYTTMEKLAPRPSMKVTAFILPPIGDNPLFISVGVGFLIYKRRNYSK